MRRRGHVEDAKNAGALSTRAPLLPTTAAAAAGGAASSTMLSAVVPVLIGVIVVVAATVVVSGYAAVRVSVINKFPGGTSADVPQCADMTFADGVLTSFTPMSCDNSTTQDGPFVLLHADPLFPNGKPIVGSPSVDVTEGASVVVALPSRGVAGAYPHATVTLSDEGIVTAATANTAVDSFAGRDNVVVPESGDYPPVLIPTGAGTLQDTIDARFLVGQATPYLSNEAVLDFDPALFSVDDLGSSFAVTRIVKTMNGTIARPINLMVDQYGDVLSADEGPVPAAPNGLATLDGAGKLLATQIPAALLSSIVFDGSWNAANNTPTLVNGSCPKNHVRYVNVAGNTTLDGTLTWIVGDRIFCINGTTWFRLASPDAGVVMFAGRTGVVVPLADDYTAAQVSATGGTVQTALNARILTVAPSPALPGQVALVGAAGEIAITDLVSTLQLSLAAFGVDGACSAAIGNVTITKGRVAAYSCITVANSVFGRDGTVVAQAGDYTTAQITSVGGNTAADSLAAMFYVAALTSALSNEILLQGSASISLSSGVIDIIAVATAGTTTFVSSVTINDRGQVLSIASYASAPVLTFNGRTGPAITPAAGDYTAAQVFFLGGTVADSLNVQFYTVASTPALSNEVVLAGSARISLVSGVIDIVAVTTAGTTVFPSSITLSATGQVLSLAAYANSPVLTFSGRTGPSITPTAGDYTAAQVFFLGGTVADSLNVPFYTVAASPFLSNEVVLAGSARISLTSGVIDMVVVTTAGTASFVSSITFNDRGQILSTTSYAGAPVLTFNGRAGPTITPASGDYTTAQVTSVGGNTAADSLASLFYVAALTTALSNEILLQGSARISLTAGVIDIISVTTAGTTLLISSLTFNAQGQVTSATSYATAPVLSFNGRTGAAITPTSGDYTATLVTCTGGNVQTALNAQHYVAALAATLPNAIVLAGTAGRISLTAGAIDLVSVVSAGTTSLINSLTFDAFGRVTASTSYATAPVLSFNGRTGAAITPTSGDYTATLVTSTGGNVQTALNAQIYVAALAATLPNAIALTGTAGRITLTAGALDLVPTGTAATYTTPLSFTTDTWGRVTAATTTTHSYVLLCSGQTPASGNILVFSGSACWNSVAATTVLPAQATGFVATLASASSTTLVTQSTQALVVPETGTYLASWSSLARCLSAPTVDTLAEVVVTIDGTQVMDDVYSFINSQPSQGITATGVRSVALVAGTRNVVFQVGRIAGSNACTLSNAFVSLVRIA